jgi:hypothetical protein
MAWTPRSLSRAEVMLKQKLENILGKANRERT